MSVFLFAALAGAAQMIAPDRWMPASVFAWQKGWKSVRIAAFSLLIFSVHVGLGFGLYAVLARLLSAVSEDNLAIFSLLFLGLIGTVRAIRFSRFREILYRGPRVSAVIYTLLSLLGPSEMIIPVLMKARADGIPPLPALLPFWAGTCLAGFAMLIMARARWNEPMALPRAIQWCQSRVSALPMAAGALVGVVLMAIRIIG